MCLKTFFKSTNRFTISDRSWRSLGGAILKAWSPKVCFEKLLTGWRLWSTSVIYSGVWSCKLVNNLNRWWLKMWYYKYCYTDTMHVVFKHRLTRKQRWMNNAMSWNIWGCFVSLFYIQEAAPWNRFSSPHGDFIVLIDWETRMLAP